MPFGLEPYAGGFDYPAQDSYQQNLAGSMFQTPAMDRYQSFLGSAPNPSDYQGGFMQKLLAGIAGLTSGIKDPAAGVQTSMGIMQAPYLQAMQQYQTMEPGFRQAASMEERSLGDRVNALRYQQQGMMDRSKMQTENQRYQNELQFKYADLEQRKQQALQNNQTAQGRMQIEQAYNNARIGIDQESNRIREMEMQNRQHGSMEDYIKNMGLGSSSSKAPNASYSELQLNSAMMSDPILRSYVNSSGGNTSINYEDIINDPDAAARLQEIYQRYGILR